MNKPAVRRELGGGGMAGVGALLSMPGHLLRRTQQIATSLFTDECGGHDLTSVQYAALVAIRDNPAIDATRLSGLIAFDRSTLGDVLERLETKGWIVRVPSPLDRRLKLVSLTAAGQALVVEVEPLVQRVEERLMAPLAPSDRAALMRLLSLLVERHADGHLRLMAPP